MSKKKEKAVEVPAGIAFGATPDKREPVMIPCEECGGSGEVDEHCSSCGYDHEEECETCDGTGEVEADEEPSP